MEGKKKREREKVYTKKAEQRTRANIWINEAK